MISFYIFKTNLQNTLMDYKEFLTTSLVFPPVKFDKSKFLWIHFVKWLMIAVNCNPKPVTSTRPQRGECYQIRSAFLYPHRPYHRHHRHRYLHYRHPHHGYHYNQFSNTNINLITATTTTSSVTLTSSSSRLPLQRAQ